jgi:hypothetical protein
MAFTTIQQDDQTVSSDIVVSPAWSNNAYTLNSFFTSSTQESGSTGKFYLNVYQTASTDIFATTQFALAYGQVNGSGSSYFNSLAPYSTPTKDVYGQWRALILGDENSKFTFDYTSGSDSIAVISVARSKYKQSFNPGSLTLKISGSNGSVILTDNSQVQTSATFINSTQYYTLVSGSAGNVYSTAGTISGSYGYVFPDLGTIILNPNALSVSQSNGGCALTFNTSNSSTSDPSPFYNYNNRILFNAIRLGANFSLQASEVISSNYIFCRAKNAENNYTANPTIIDTNGNLIYNQLIYSPVTYITSVGLYNDNNELLAVAKLSKPLQKDFTKEALVRVKLDYVWTLLGMAFSLFGFL